MGRSRFSRAAGEIDRYLESLSYEKLVAVRSDKLHEKLFRDISVIVLKHYEALDVTKKTELQVSVDADMYGLRINVTGYIEIGEERYIQIEKTYESRRCEDEE